MKKRNTVIFIAGPTASGKTALALELAEYLNTSIISADSRQCFRELNIGVAKPKAEELKRVKHYFINSHSVTETVTAQTFENYALQSVEKIFERNRFAIMAGGTGLYIKAFCEGLDAIPEADSQVRKKIADNYKEQGIEWLQEELQNGDPEFWKHAEQKNPQRLMRALEIFYTTGKSIVFYRNNRKTERPFEIIKFGLDISKAQLSENIELRTDAMIEAGLVNEVRSLITFKNLNALQTVGYREVFKYLENEISLTDAIENIKVHTRQYAKRQMTWFKKDKKIIWIQAANVANIMSLLTVEDREALFG